MGTHYLSKIHIAPYDGFIGNTHTYISGRVLKNKKVVYKPNDGKIRNIVNSWINFKTNELSDIEVVLELGGNFYKSETDEEGYFFFDIDNQSYENPVDSANQWDTYAVHIVSQNHKQLKSKHNIHAKGRLYEPHHQAAFGIITDIDDTLLKTDINTVLRWRMFYNSVLLNPFQRKIVPGSNHFYNQVVNVKNPIFYISNSPNNLNPYVRVLLDHNNFPTGPIFLRDIGRQMLRPRQLTDGAKYKHSKKLIEAFPQLSFLLFGDAAESDIDIYVELYKEYKDRIRMIAIRSLGDVKKDQSILEMKTVYPDIPLQLFTDFAKIELDPDILKPV